MHGSAGFPLVESGILELGGLYGFDDLPEIDVLSRAREHVSARGTTARINDSASSEVIKNLN